MPGIALANVNMEHDIRHSKHLFFRTYDSSKQQLINMYTTGWPVESVVVVFYADRYSKSRMKKKSYLYIDTYVLFYPSTGRIHCIYIILTLHAVRISYNDLSVGNE